MFVCCCNVLFSYYTEQAGHTIITIDITLHQENHVVSATKQLIQKKKETKEIRSPFHHIRICVMNLLYCYSCPNIKKT